MRTLERLRASNDALAVQIFSKPIYHAVYAFPSDFSPEILVLYDRPHGLYYRRYIK